jgi:hypothetical protein
MGGSEGEWLRRRDGGFGEEGIKVGKIREGEMEREGGNRFSLFTGI